MKQTRKIILIVASVAAVLIVGLAVLFALTYVVKADYTGHINKGNKYLASGEYDKAVLEFKSAMEMDEEKDEAYIGLFTAYDSLGYLTLSQQILEQGFSRTGSEDMRLMLSENFPDSAYLTEDGAEGKLALAEPVLNREILATIAGSTYGDYAHQYEVSLVSSEGKIFTYEVEELGMELEYDNAGSTNKINQGEKKPYREMMPDHVSLDSLSTLFGTTAPITVEELKELEGVRELQELDDGVTFKAAGCRVTIYNEGELILSDSENTIASLKELGEADEEEEGADTKTLKGNITDAKTGDPVPDAKISIYEGKSASGKPLETKSNNSGLYSADVEGGDYYIVVEKEGYITGTFTTYVMTKSDISYQDCALSPVMKRGEIRIVLTWDATPRDLDSYLQGTSGSGKRIMTNYTSRSQTDSNGDLIAELDLDDTDGNGPETTTLYDMEGSYEFYVKDYLSTGTMGRTNAQVTVYKDNALVETIHITPDAVNRWMVLKIEKGEITVINQP